MEEGIKNRVMMILAILSTIFFIGTVGSCSSLHRQKAARDKEMAMRLDIEEKMNKIMQEKTVAEEKLKAKDKELEEMKSAQQTLSKDLAQEQLVTQSLKEELHKSDEFKKALERDLKDALVNDKAASKARK
ncbi:MAG: hypothetical protein WC510_02535 [Candidatus Omnitrophota bacterium]